MGEFGPGDMAFPWSTRVVAAGPNRDTFGLNQSDLMGTVESNQVESNLIESNRIKSRLRGVQ